MVTVSYFIVKNGHIRQLLWHHRKEDILRQRSGAGPRKMVSTFVMPFSMDPLSPRMQGASRKSNMNASGF